MKYDKYLIDYLDGELDKEFESDFFYELSINEDLRNKLSFLKRTKNITTGFLENVIVPETSSNALFSKLGLAYENLDNNVINEIKVEKKRNKLYLIPAIFMAAIVGYLIGYFIYDNKTENAGNYIDRKTMDNSYIEKYIGKLDKNDANLPKEIIDNKQYIIPKSVPETSQIDDDIIEINSGNNEIILSESSFINKNIPKINESKFNINELEIPNNKSNLGNELNQINTFHIENFDNYTKHKFAIEFGRADYIAFDDRTKQNVNLTIVNNFSLRGIYFLNENIGIGLEYKPENFSGTVYDNQNLVNIEKSTIGETKGFIIRFENQKNNLKPFGQITVGAFDDGGVFKLSTGVSYKLYEKFSMFMSIEYSGYINSYYGNINNFQKLGLNYGIAFNY